MVLNDLWEAAVEADVNGEEVINVFHFQQIETGNFSASDLALRIINQWITANWETLVGLGFSFIQIAVRNLFDDSVQATTPVGIVGDGLDDLVPPHDAINITMFTPNPTITGSKRFTGLTEVGQAEGIWNAQSITGWQDFATNILAQPLLGVGGIPRYQYVIVKRIPYVTPSGSTAYRLPENQAEAVYASVLSGVAEDTVRTQKSRDYNE